MKSSQVSVGENALATQYNDLRSDAKGGSFLLPHQQGTPNMTLAVEAGVFYIGNTRVIFAGGNSPSFTAPTTNPRIDLLTINSSGTLAVTQGTEAASPSAPTYPTDKIVICEVYNRVGETSIKDTSDGTNGYIYNDTRPTLWAGLSIVDAQIASAAAIQVSKIRKNSNILPETDNTYDVGSSTFQWREVRAKKLYKDNIEVGAKFGGTGSDGALSVTTGTTNIDAASAAYVVKNYTSLSISNGATLGLINPHASGTLLHIKVSGNFTWDGKIDLKGDGASGGNGGSTDGSGGGSGNIGTGIICSTENENYQYSTLTTAIIVWNSSAGMGGGLGSPATGSAKRAGGGGGGASKDGGSDGGNAGGGANGEQYNFGWAGRGGRAANQSNGGFTSNIMNKYIFVCAGSGGGGGGRADTASGNGGRGGGGLLIEVAGTVTIAATATLDLSGDNGTSASGAASYGAGGGGGGAAGVGKLIAGGTITNNGLTTTLTGGTGGSSTHSSGAGGAGSAGSWDMFSNNDFV